MQWLYDYQYGLACQWSEFQPMVNKVQSSMCIFATHYYMYKLHSTGLCTNWIVVFVSWLPSMALACTNYKWAGFFEICIFIIPFQIVDIDLHELIFMMIVFVFH